MKLIVERQQWSLSIVVGVRRSAHMTWTDWLTLVYICDTKRVRQVFFEQTDH
jgi:hypothetical protein